MRTWGLLAAGAPYSVFNVLHSRISTNLVVKHAGSFAMAMNAQGSGSSVFRFRSHTRISSLVYHDGMIQHTGSYGITSRMMSMPDESEGKYRPGGGGGVAGTRGGSACSEFRVPFCFLPMYESTFSSFSSLIT